MIFAMAEDIDSLFHALEYQDHGDVDEESLLPYYDGDKKPRVVRSPNEAPEDFWTSGAWATIWKSTPWPSSSTPRNSYPSSRSSWSQNTAGIYFTDQPFAMVKDLMASEGQHQLCCQGNRLVVASPEQVTAWCFDTVRLPAVLINSFD